MATDKIVNTPYSMQQIINEVLGHLVYDEIGTIKQWAFNTIPAGHLEFNGATLLKADYSELWQKALNSSMVGSGLFFEDVDTTKFKIADCSDEIFRNYGATSGRYDKTSFNANTTSGSNVITGLGYTSFMFVGMPVSGAGIPVGATVSSIDSTTQVKISTNATATATGVYLTFSGRKLGTVELGQIENITGTISPVTGTYNVYPAGQGAFVTSGGYYNTYNSGPSPLCCDTVTLDASKVVKAGPETRTVNRSVKYIIKAKNIVGIDPTIHQANANFLDGLTGSAYAKVLGNPSNAFQVANAVNTNEAVNLGQFGNVSTQNGYTKFPNGLILQWGYAYNPVALTSSQTIMFPIAFPNACLNIVNQPKYGGSWDTFYQNIASFTNSGFTTNYTISRYWQAIGY